MKIERALRYLSKSALCILADVVLLGPLMTTQTYIEQLFVASIMVGIVGIGVIQLALFAGTVMRK